MNKYTISKKLLAMVMVIVILAGSIGFLVFQNFSLSQANSELFETNEKLSKSNDELTTQLQNVIHELDAIKQNYTQLLSYFGPNPNPVIETRLGIKLLDRPTIGDNHLWVTGEIENTENVTVYNAILNFTLFTLRGVDTKPIVVGTMEPHQVVFIRTNVQTVTGKIINWSLDAEATYLP